MPLQIAQDYHFCLEALQKVFLLYSNAFSEHVACDKPTRKCFSNGCLKFKDAIVFKVKYPLMKFLKEPEKKQRYQ